MINIKTSWVARLNAGVCGLALLAFAPKVMAGDGAPEKAGQTQDIEEIRVIGQKSEKSLREVTASVSIETGAEIEREPLADLFDIVVRVPNVTATLGGQGFAIRGVDQRGIGGGGLTLTVYVDDAPLANQSTFFGPTGAWDLAQVEVYRGPQSTNFGRNTLAGAIYIRSQDPTYDYELKARAEVGSDGHYWGAVAGGGAIIDDKLAFRIAADYREDDGFVRNTFLDADADASEYWSTRLKFLIEPTDDLRIITTTSYTENFAGEDNISPFSGGNFGDILDADDVRREVAYDQPGREGTETFLQSVNVMWDINEHFSLQSITSYQSTDYLRLEDFDVSPAPIAVLDRVGNDEALTEEFRLRYTDDSWQVALGLYYADLEDGFTDDFIVPGSLINPAIPPTVLIGRTGQNSSRIENIAVFLDGEYKINDQFDILFGLRYDNEHQEDTQITSTRAVSPLPPGFEFLSAVLGESRQTTEADYEAWLPKAGLRWRSTEDLTFSFVVQRAYRAGGAQINFVDGSLAEFDPEYLWNFELSSRAQFLDDRINWNVNIYYSDWSDQQVTVPLPAPFNQFFETLNAGTSELYGLETDISYAVNSNLQVYAGVGVSVAEFVDFANGNFDPSQPVSEANQDNFAGNRFPFAPRLSLNGGFSYTDENGIFGGVDINYQSSAFNEIENVALNQADARTIVNARLGYRVTENISVSAFVRNLLDDQYFTSLGRVGGANFSRLGDPLTWALRLDISF